uniref:Uncharacterized protein LOC100184093 n=1 Tax=Phallusia mammillata TaxID=59560 RepID=A0A6F9DIQ8_9ASCI|nr:uncharacterized protein LOC100184093 [Phallusia mammillata]
MDSSSKQQQVKYRRSAMKSSSRVLRSSNATLDSESSAATVKSSRQVSSRKPPKSKSGRKCGERKLHGGIIENRWSQPDLTASPIKNPLRRFVSTQDLLLTSDTESTSSVVTSLKSPKQFIGQQRNSCAPYRYNKTKMNASATSSPSRIPSRKAIRDMSNVSVENRTRRMYREASLPINAKKSNQSLFEATSKLVQNVENDSFSSTEVDLFNARIEGLEQTNQKLSQQNHSLEKQLKQASELVRILLGKTKEAERKTRKVSELEMEIIVLRRQLAQNSSHDRIISVSSTLSDDIGWRSESDSVFDQSEARKTPLGISDSTSPDSSDCDVSNKENFLFPSTCFSRTSTLQRTRPMAPQIPDATISRSRDALGRMDLNSNYPTAHSCGNDERFNSLLNEHKRALKLIQNLETKFCSQQKVVTGLKRDISSMKHKSHSQSLEDVQDQLSLLIQSLQNENMSTEDIGQYLVETFHKDSTLDSGHSTMQRTARYYGKSQRNHSARRSLSLS